MIKQGKAPTRNATDQVDVVQASANLDIVKEGVLYRNMSVQQVLVGSSSDLSLLTDYEYPAGTIAFTAGYSNVWQKAPNGTWSAIVSES